MEKFVDFLPMLAAVAFAVVVMVMRGRLPSASGAVSRDEQRKRRVFWNETQQIHQQLLFARDYANDRDMHGFTEAMVGALLSWMSVEKMVELGMDARSDKSDRRTARVMIDRYLDAYEMNDAPAFNRFWMINLRYHVGGWISDIQENE
ncbi:hypothetical protein HQ524_02100 [Candidatus Uhrbacteria bacterium]|nr:hypothetical protein [Candidatus Uhrbacteria bacterium]